MASPQTENGFTKIANELLDAIIQRRLSGQEYQVLFCILRKTYGFGKKADMLSMGQIAKATGMNRPRAAMILSMLKTKNIVGVTKNDNSGVTKNGNSSLNIVELNKDYEAWRVLPKKVTVTKNDNRVLPKMVTKVLPKMIHTKERKKLLQKKEEVEIPQTLKTPEFEQAWNEWQKHLAEKKTRTTPTAFQKQLAKCEQWGIELAIHNINYSIEHSWQGLYADKNKPATVQDDYQLGPDEIKEIIAFEDQLKKEMGDEAYAARDQKGGK